MASTLPLSRRGKLPIRFGMILLLVPLALLGPFLGPLIIRVVAFEAFEADGPSMEPTLLHGDRFVIDKSAYGLRLPLVADALVTWREPDPGDVVVLWSAFDNILILKRVIGVSGDRIEIRDDVVLRNGTPIQRRVVGPCGWDDECELVEEGIGQRTWQTSRSTFAIPDSLPEVSVPAGHVFVLGDHRDRSNDSRNPRVGMIPVSRLVGPATRIYYSTADPDVRWDRIGQRVQP